ncbi:peroxidase-related enzyme [Leucobacter sp. wl10]|uniref:peroxidase-related enzyme n=1 Tax=Leucobacter sp. wl10 TaxID=2304677 RepID=UPI000E5B95D5|nr:peroxidase-related enzyme [Leucobacter sp. wl10]RGE23123.1 alkylhydroperoxidase [Leucobacter sp. wl10]
MTFTDPLERLIGDSEHLIELRRAKPAVFEQTGLAYDALYGGEHALPAGVLRAFAARVAAWHGNAPLHELHSAEGADPTVAEGADIADDRVRLLRDHLDILVVSPALATRDDLLLLADAGVSPDEIVLVSQLAAYESYLARAVAGFSALDGRALDEQPPPASAPRTNGRVKELGGLTATGDPKPREFTREVLEWQPWVPPVEQGDLTPEQADSFAAKTTANSPYFRLLARVPAILKARSALDNAVFLPREGLPKAERELSAAVASKVNDCIYCASVHARKSAVFSKRPGDVDRLLASALERDANWQAVSVAPLSEGQDERWSAIIDAAARLSLLRPGLRGAEIERLRALGLTTGELADLIASTAFFAWANRLMLTLGEPMVPPND